MPDIPETLTENYSILKVEIDNNWNADDFSDLFNSINRLYGYHLLLIQAHQTLDYKSKQYNVKEDFEKFPEFLNLAEEFKKASLRILRNSNVENSHSFLGFFNLSMSFPLNVLKVKFGSKGSIDILGIGKIFEIIKDIIFNYVPNESEKLNNLIKEKEVEEREQKILQMRIENLKKLGLNTDDILTIIGHESFYINKIKLLVGKKNINDLLIEEQSKK